MSACDELVAELREKDEATRQKRLLAFAIKNRPAVLELSKLVIIHFSRSGTLEQIIAFLELRDFPDLIDFALSALEMDCGNRCAQVAIYRCASAQCVELLHPKLEILFQLALRIVQAESKQTDPFKRYHSLGWDELTSPWRNSGKKYYEFLRPIAEDPAKTIDERELALECMLATRDPDLIQWALEFYGRNDSNELASRCSLLIHGLDSIGLTKLSDGIKRLYPETVFFLAFPIGYLFEHTDLEKLPAHPTWFWNYDSLEAPEYSFGGKSNSNCGVCQRNLSQIIELEPVPRELGITEFAKISLATCLSCLYWQRRFLFYKHHSDGELVNISFEGSTQFQYETDSGPLLSSKVKLARAPARWQWRGAVTYGENDFRFGGLPDWVQNAEYPNCPICACIMNFILQLDSEIPEENGAWFVWANCEKGYVFWCDSCKVSAFLTQAS